MVIIKKDSNDSKPERARDKRSAVAAFEEPFPKTTAGTCPNRPDSNLLSQTPKSAFAPLTDTSAVVSIKTLITHYT